MSTRTASCWLAGWMATTALIVSGVAQAAEGTPRLVSVTGSGEVKAQPDMASVTLGVEARNPSLAAARAEDSPEA